MPVIDMQSVNVGAAELVAARLDDGVIQMFGTPTPARLR
jgi:hypothetical protein